MATNPQVRPTKNVLHRRNPADSFAEDIEWRCEKNKVLPPEMYVGRARADAEIAESNGQRKSRHMLRQSAAARFLNPVASGPKSMTRKLMFLSRVHRSC